MTAPSLLPSPRSVTWTGGTCPSNAAVSVTRDAALPAEGYRLSITKDGVELVHADAAGLRHARATLAQLEVQGPLPCAVLEDYPAFAVRGLMLDCSRDRIPTRVELSRLLRQMASWKMNHLQLYCEHVIRYRGHEAVAPADGISLEELADISREAQALGIEVAGNQNCFGHMERWFQHAAYEPLAELLGHPGHHHRCGCRCLAPAVAEAIDLPRDLITQQAAILPSPIFNIGGDETWDLGKGRSADLVARDGYASVYGHFLRQVMNAARDAGKVPAFWADIVLHHPAAAQTLDREAIALDWGYGGCHDFIKSQTALREAGFTHRWVCPGTSCWSTWGGQSDERRSNLQRAARQGLEAGAEGFLVTVWGDAGHRQIWPASLAGIAEAAHRAWSSADSAYEPRAAGRFAFGSDALGPWIDELGQLDRPLRDGARWETCFKALHERIERHPQIPWTFTGPTVIPGASAPSEWQGIVAHAYELRARLPAGIDELIAAECRHAVALIMLGAERGCEAIGGSARSADWGARLEAAINEHRRLWLLRSRASGLADSAGAFREVLG